MEALLVPISLLAGGSLALQAGANTQLAKATGNPFAATLLQLAVATVVLLVVALPTGSLVALANLAGVPWWHAVGGTASAFFVVSTILLFPRLGAVVSVGLIIAGQMLASLILDGFGLFGVPEASFGASTLIGTFAVLGGTVAIVVGQSGAEDHLSASKLGWVLLALSAGAALPVQGAVNGLLKWAPRCAVAGRSDQLPGREPGHGRHASRLAAVHDLPEAAARQCAQDAVVGVARRVRRRPLRDDHVLGNSGHRHRVGGRSDGCRTADSFGLRRSIRLVSTAAATGIADPNSRAWRSC